MIDRRRALMGVNDNYEDLKYLQSNGHQYIDLNYAPNNNSGFYIDFTTVTYNDDVVFGCTSNGKKWWINSYGGGAYVWWATSTVDVFENIINRRLTFELNYLNSRELKNRATGYTKAISGDLTQLGNNACLFAGRSADGNVKFHAKIKCSEVEITEGNAVLMHLLPKLRKSDGKPGMYDTLRNVFLVNNGSGEFGYEKLDGTIVAPI